MHDALNKTGKPIYYGICNWGRHNVTGWAFELGNSWRTTPDIYCAWQSIMDKFIRNDEHPEIAAPGGWNDPDMLEIGNGCLTFTEERTHFALWCVDKAPLLIGCDFDKASKESLDIMKAKLLI